MCCAVSVDMESRENSVTVSCVCELLTYLGYHTNMNSSCVHTEACISQVLVCLSHIKNTQKIVGERNKNCVHCTWFIKSILRTMILHST